LPASPLAPDHNRDVLRQLPARSTVSLSSFPVVQSLVVFLRLHGF
jgi:hypothetical protein